MNAPRVDFPPFDAHPLIAGARRMTVFGALARRGHGRMTRAEESRVVSVDATTRVRMKINRPPGTAGTTGAAGTPRSALLILHGLVGSSESPYVLGTAAKGLARGFLVARLNARNCGGTEALTQTAYNGGQTAEIGAAASELVASEGIERVHLVGFSVGGNQVLRFTIQVAPAPPAWLTSTTAISPCIDFRASSAALERGPLLGFARRRFVAGLKSIVRRRHALYPGTISLEGIDEIRTVREFDDRYTAPLSGYRDACDYYARVSTHSHLREIETPTLLLTARDDPFIPIDSFLGLDLGRAPIQLVTTPRGGHVGHIGRQHASNGHWQDTDRRWAENRAVQFAVAMEDG